MEITLAKALKLKNKKIREIKELSNIIIENNSIIEGNKFLYDIKDIFNKYEKTKEELTKLKAEIQKANQDVQKDIFMLSELKDEYKNINMLSCKQGYVNESLFRDSVQNKYISYITVSERDEILKRIEKEIENLQDKLDEYNHKTKIKIDIQE